MHLRKGAQALTVVTAAVVMASCSSGKSQATAPPPSTATTSTTAAPTTTAPATTAPAPTAAPVPSTTPPATVAHGSACQIGQLAVSDVEGGAGLGHSAVIVHFENTSHASCSLQGYPGVAGLDGAGHQVVQAQRTPSGYMGGLMTPGGAPPVVTLAPGRTASAKVEGTDNPPGTATSCPQLAGLLVTPPDTFTSVRVPAAPSDCSGLQVHPIVPGDTGNLPS